MPEIQRKYGWVRDLPDHRDYKLKLPRAEVLPPVVDLRSKCPPVFDQQSLGSCTSNAIANAHRFDQIKQGFDPNWAPSRLFIYYNERDIEDTVDSDSGASIRDGIKSINQLGVCPESEWPYIESKFTNKPPASCYTEALRFTSLLYQAVDQDLVSLKTALNAGYPIVFGFSVYSSFEGPIVAATGIVPMPGKDEDCLGGHAVLCVGFSDADSTFLCMNSWGILWGLPEAKGYFKIPYAYVTNPDLADDFWTVTEVKDAPGPAPPPAKCSLGNWFRNLFFRASAKKPSKS